MKPHEFAKLVNALRITAVKYKDTQQLREQLSKTLKEHNIRPRENSNGN